MFRNIPGSYLSMMALTGASIGAITAFSKTSVSNTLIEVVLVFISGSAGLYFLNRKALQTEGAAIRAIGGIGVMFLGCFWAAFLGLQWLWPAETVYAPWDKARPLAENLAEVELRGHLARLGVDPALAGDLGPVPATLPPAAAGGCLAEGDAPGAALLVGNVYRKMVRESCLRDPAAYQAATFIASDFQRVQSGRIGAGAADRAAFDGAAAALLALARRAPDLAAPDAFACNRSEAEQAAAEALAARLMLCLTAPELRALHLVRSHAAAFQSIWGDPIDAEIIREGIVMESLRDVGPN